MIAIDNIVNVHNVLYTLISLDKWAALALYLFYNSVIDTIYTLLRKLSSFYDAVSFKGYPLPLASSLKKQTVVLADLLLAGASFHSPSQCQ